MTPSLRQWKTCTRKKAYPSREAAFQKGQEVYQCRYCHQFHRSGSLSKLVAALQKIKT
jgi:Zn-finger protein